MDKIIEKFYNGSIPNGGYNKPRLTSNKFSSPNLLENRYNRTNENNKYNLRYSNGQKIMENAPVPRTQYSMGLNSLTIKGNPPFYRSAVNPYRVDEDPYSTLTKNFKPNKLKLSILDYRIKEMEDENKRNKLKIKRLMEGSYFAPEKPYWNSNPNYANNPKNLNDAMDNLRNPYLTLEEFKTKQDMRRNIVQYELEKARQRLNGGNYNNENNKINNDNNQKFIEQPIQNEQSEKSFTINNYSSEENESVTEETERKMKKEYNKLMKEIKKEREYNEMYENDMNNIEEKIIQMERQNNYNNEELNLLRQKNQEMYNMLKSKEEAEDFINNIPDHVALQLQNDNFKIRSNLNTIKEGFRQIKNDLENKLESLELKQNYNFEMIKKIIEDGGNRRMKAGFRKYMNYEDIDLNSIKDELPEHLQFLPEIIEQKIKENEELKNQEKNREINRQMNKRLDMMNDYKYGYANSFYKYKNPNNNFVVSKNYGRFQYIPKKNNNINSNNNNFRRDSFKQNAEANLMIMREKEKSIPGIYAYGVGNKNMNNRIPIKMNGCYDDWFKDKNSADFQIDHSESNVGISAIKKNIKVRSNNSLSLQSKPLKKIEPSESEKKSKDDKKSKDKKSKEESEEESDKKDKKGDKEDKDDKKEDKDDKGSGDSSDESSEESDQESKEGSKKESKKGSDSGSGSDSDSDGDSD